MNVNDKIFIFQDGKLCRDIPATVTSKRSAGIQVSFEVDGQINHVWCRRRDKKGKYEVIGWNYWIIPGYSVTGYQT